MPTKRRRRPHPDTHVQGSILMHARGPAGRRSCRAAAGSSSAAETRSREHYSAQPSRKRQRPPRASAREQPGAPGSPREAHPSRASSIEPKSRISRSRPNTATSPDRRSSAAAPPPPPATSRTHAGAADASRNHERHHHPGSHQSASLTPTNSGGKRRQPQGRALGQEQPTRRHVG